jgi:hypothetical protein
MNSTRSPNLIGEPPHGRINPQSVRNSVDHHRGFWLLGSTSEQQMENLFLFPAAGVVPERNSRDPRGVFACLDRSGVQGEGTSVIPTGLLGAWITSEQQMENLFLFPAAGVRGHEGRTPLFLRGDPHALCLSYGALAEEISDGPAFGWPCSSTSRDFVPGGRT